MRYCGRCGEPMDDHEVKERVAILVRRPDRGRLRIQRIRVDECPVRLIATSPVTHKTLVPGTPQRIKVIDTRYVASRRFEKGKDLNT